MFRKRVTVLVKRELSISESEYVQCRIQAHYQVWVRAVWFEQSYIHNWGSRAEGYSSVDNKLVRGIMLVVMGAYVEIKIMEQAMGGRNKVNAACVKGSC